MRAGTVIKDHAGLTGVARIMDRAGGNAVEEEGSLYQPSLQSGLGDSQSNDTDASSIDTNGTPNVEDGDNPGHDGRGHGRGRGRGPS
jgi:hypothetical protein